MKRYIKPTVTVVLLAAESAILAGSQISDDPGRTSGWTTSDQKHGFGIYQEGYGKYEDGLNDDDLGAKGHSQEPGFWDE